MIAFSCPRCRKAEPRVAGQLSQLPPRICSDDMSRTTTFSAGSGARLGPGAVALVLDRLAPPELKARLGLGGVGCQ